MQLPAGTTTYEAQAQAVAELPSDAKFVFFAVKKNTVTGSCATLELRSATLARILGADPNIGGGGTVDFILSSANSDLSGSIYDPNNVQQMNVSIGFGLASAKSGAC